MVAIYAGNQIVLIYIRAFDHCAYSMLKEVIIYDVLSGKKWDTIDREKYVLFANDAFTMFFLSIPYIESMWLRLLIK